MKAIRWIFVCAVLVAGWPTPMAADQTETERVHKVVALAPGGTVKLHNFSGHVTITGTDRNEVVVDAVRKATKDRLERIKLDVSSSGNIVTIEANKKDRARIGLLGNNVVETDFEIQVPRRSTLDINVFSSPVTVTGVSGSHLVRSFSGRLELTDIAGAVSAKTFSGRIRVGLVGVDRPDLELTTFSGGIEVRVPSTVQAKLDFDSFSGDLTSDLPLTLDSKHGHRLLARINAGDRPGGTSSGASDVRLKTFSGDVRIIR